MIWSMLIRELLLSILLFFILPVFIKLVIAILMGYKDKLSILGVTFINLITFSAAITMINMSIYTISIFWGSRFLKYFLPSQLILFSIIFTFIEWRLLIYTLGNNKLRHLLLALIMNFIAYFTIYIIIKYELIGYVILFIN